MKALAWSLVVSLPLSAFLVPTFLSDVPAGIFSFILGLIAVVGLPACLAFTIAQSLTVPKADLVSMADVEVDEQGNCGNLPARSADSELTPVASMAAITTIVVAISCLPHLALAQRGVAVLPLVSVATVIIVGAYALFYWAYRQVLDLSARWLGSIAVLGFTLYTALYNGYFDIAASCAVLMIFMAIADTASPGYFDRK